MRIFSLLVTLGLSFAALLLIWPYVSDSVPRSVRKWVGVGIAIVCVLPQIIFEVLFPKPFDISAYSDSVDYEFASIDYAIAFAQSNSDADWVKVDGHVVDLSADDSDSDGCVDS